MENDTKQDGAQWIDARFGPGWADHAVKTYTPAAIADIAITNGRQKIVLENALKKIYKLDPNDTSFDYAHNVREIAKRTLDQLNGL